MSYANKTQVSVEQSQMEIQRLLQRYGATGFGINWGSNTILFEIKSHAVKIQIPLPDRNDFKNTSGGSKRNNTQIDTAYDQALKQRWRALVLVIKAKLEAITTGITTIENEFMAHFVLPNGQTLSQYILPQMKTTSIFPVLPDQ